MATPQTTYFGDLNVTGNTTLSGNLAVLGSFAYFASNLVPTVDGQSTIGPVANVYVGGANTTVLTGLTTISNGIGIGTTANSGTALNVSGNLAVSNAIQTPVIRVTTANAGQVNVTSIRGPGFVGLNTTGPSGTALYVSGFANASENTLTTNVQVSNLNVTTLNAFTFAAASNLGIGTGPTSGGPTLRVFGNVFGSNALQTVNVLATTVNVTTANIVSIPGPVGVSGPALAHAKLAVYGNVAVSSEFTTPALNASAAGTVSEILNVTSLVTGSNLGIGTTPVSGGPALHIIGNVVVSNTFSAPDTFTSSWNISDLANTLTVTATKDFLVGGTTAGANVSVTGNAFVSNSIQTANIFASFTNTTTINTASIISPIISVNGTSPLLYSPWSGSFDPISSQNLTTTSITGSPQLKTNSDPSGSGPSLGLNDGSSYILYNFSPTKFIDLYNGGITYMTWLKINQTGNDYFLIFRSASSTEGWGVRLYRDGGTNLIVRASKGGGTAAASITGITNGVWRHIAVSLNAFNDDTLRLYVNGTQVDTSGLASTNRPPAAGLISQSFSIGETGSIVTNADFAGTGLFPGLSASQIAQIYSATARDTLSSSLVYGNTFASNTLTTSSLAASQINVSARSNLFSLATSNVGIGTTPVASGATLVVQGNVAVSNALTTGTVFVTNANATTLNTASIFGPSGNVGINTTTDFGTDLYVAGNIYASNSITVANFNSSNLNTTSVNALSITAGTSAVVVAPYTNVSQYFQGSVGIVTNAPTSNTAISFPGTSGNYISLGTTGPTTFDTNSSNLFVEAWVYVTSGTIGRIYGRALTVTSIAPNYDFTFRVNAGILGIANGTTVVPAPGTVTSGTWNHCAASITTTGLVTVFLNGQAGTPTSTTMTYNATYPTFIGAMNGSYLNGFIQDLRVVKDGIVPTTSFTPDPAPFLWTCPSYVIAPGTTVFAFNLIATPSLTVQGNVFVSNALTTPNVFATTANITTSGIDFVPGPVGINTTGASGTTLYVSGNLVASNALGATNVNVVTANITSGITLTTPLIIQNLGGTGNSLEVRGNAYVSNELETTNLTALTSLNTTTLNVLSISGRTGINTTLASGTSLYVSGNGYASNALVTSNAFVSTFNVARTTNTNTVELASATVRPAPDLVRYLRGGATIASGAPSYSGPTLSLGGGVSADPPAAVFGAAHPLNFDPTTSNIFIEAFIYHQDTGGQTFKTIFTIGDPNRTIGIGQPIQFTVDSGYRLNAYWRVGATGYTLLRTGALSSSTWYHVACAFNVVNSTVNIFLNGAGPTTDTILGPLVSGPLNFSAAIGASQNSGNKYGFPGYISDLRVMRGGTVPTASFTAPTAPGTFSTTAPSYFAGGTTIFTLSDYMTPRLGANLTVGGNVIASNAITTTNINTISSTNVSALGNVSVVSRASAVIVRGVYANTALGVGANVVVSNGLTVANIFGTRINTATLNTSSLFGNVGINTTADRGTGLFVTGNLYMSNVTTSVPNVYAITAVNASSLINTASIFGQSGFVGVNTTAASGTTLYVQGNLSMSNVTTRVPNVYATAAVNASGLVNTASIFGPSGFVGVNTTSASGTTLYVQGNVYASNALVAPNLNVVTANATTTNVSAIFGTSEPIGINTTAASGTDLYVQGNLYASNALTTPNLIVTTANATTTNVSAIFGTSEPVGINTTAASGTDLYVQGNLYASNALTGPNLIVTTANATTTNVSAIFGTSEPVGINTTAASGTDLYVRGNLYASNALTGTNLIVTTANATTTNVSAIFGPSGFVGLNNTAASGTTLYVDGNVYASNALSAPNISAPYTNALTVVVGSGGAEVGSITTAAPNLSVGGNLWSSNALTAPAVYGGINATTSNVTSIFSSDVSISLYPYYASPAYSTTFSPTFNSSNIYFPNGYDNSTGAYLDFGSQVFNLGTRGFSARVLIVFNQIGTLSWQRIFDFNSGNSGVGDMVLAFRANTGNLLFSYRESNGTNSTDSVSTFTTGVLYDIAVTYDPTVGSTGRVTIYVNGAVDTTNTSMAAGATDKTFTRTFIGRSSYPGDPSLGAYIYYFNAYNRVLTRAELTQPQLFSIQRSLAYVGGNIYASNTLSAPGTLSERVNAAAIVVTSGSVGVGTVGPVGSTLYVQGNLAASNALTAPNLNVVTANTTTTNVSAIFGPSGSVGVNTTAASGTDLYVQGNLYASNAFVAPTLNVVTANTTTTNASAIFGPSGFVGLNTTTASGTTLYVRGNLYASNALKATNINVVTANTTTTNVSTIFGPSGFVGLNTTAASGTALYVRGNLYASNALTAPRLVVTTANSTTTNVSAIFGPSGSVGLNTTAASGTDLYVRGNLYASNALTAPNINVVTANTTTMNVSAIFGPAEYVGINTTAASGTDLYVQGNLYASNALSTPNVFTTNIDAYSNLNAFSLVTQYVNAAALGWSNTNIYMANSITTTNIFATNVNSAAYWSTTGTVGVNTTTATGAALYVAGNLYASNAFLTVPNVAGTPWIYYKEDLTKRWPHLLPTPSNAASIQNWISATCNAASQPTEGWWSTSRTPVFANVAGGPTGSNDYCGSVLLPDGRVLFVPASASSVGFFNTVDGTFSAVTPAGLSAAANKYRGGVLTPNGNVVFVPFQTNYVGVYNPVSSQFSTIGPYNVGINGFENGVLARNGKVIFVPRDSANVGIFDWTTLTMSNLRVQGASTSGFCGGCLLPNGNVAFVPAVSRNVGMLSADQSTFSNIGPFFTSGPFKFMGGVLAPNGNVIMVPGFATSGNVAVFNPANSTCSNVQTGVPGTTGSFQGGVLSPTGNVIFAPATSGNVGQFDPVALTYSNLVVGGLDSVTYNKFYGATLIPDGRVVFTPMALQNVCVLDTFTPAPPEFCLAPYFNKL